MQDRVDIRRPPPVSAATLDLVEAAGPGRSGEAVVAAAVASDPGLAARVLATANGAPFGVARGVAGLHQAVVELGGPVVRTLALESRADALDAGQVAGHHRHAQLVACAARLLAPRAGVAPDVAFLAGLLHDLGELLLARAAPDRHGSLVGAGADHRGQLRAEAAAFGTDHALAGAEHLLEWRIPDEVADAVADHDEPFATSSPTTVVVAAADELTTAESGRTHALGLLGLDLPAAAALRRRATADVARGHPLVQPA